VSGDVLVVLGTFVYCIGSGVIPVMHAEAYLVSASLLAPPQLAWPLVLAATAGQMVAKTAMYGAGRGALLLPYPWLQRRLAAAKTKMEGRRDVGNALIFVSASTGFPPFYVVSVAAGMLNAPLAGFVLFGAMGRFLRFTVAVFLPHLLKS
jgi:membrane protein YqaA with SNARE-associated domain